MAENSSRLSQAPSPVALPPRALGRDVPRYLGGRRLLDTEADERLVDRTGDVEHELGARRTPSGAREARHDHVESRPARWPLQHSAADGERTFAEATGVLVRGVREPKSLPVAALRASRAPRRVGHRPHDQRAALGITWKPPAE
jgi:hypothetical protein